MDDIIDLSATTPPESGESDTAMSQEVCTQSPLARAICMCAVLIRACNSLRTSESRMLMGKRDMFRVRLRGLATK